MSKLFIFLGITKYEKIYWLDCKRLNDMLTQMQHQQHTILTYTIRFTSFPYSYLQVAHCF
jgi:hypothetical protein